MACTSFLAFSRIPQNMSNVFGCQFRRKLGADENCSGWLLACRSSVQNLSGASQPFCSTSAPAARVFDLVVGPRRNSSNSFLSNRNRVPRWGHGRVARGMGIDQWFLLAKWAQDRYVWMANGKSTKIYGESSKSPLIMFSESSALAASRF